MPSRTKTGTLALVAAALALAPTAPLAAQTDYYNTDHGRPVRIEDAHSVERYAFEVQLAPLRLERVRGGAYHWEVEPEVAYGILPATHVGIGLPIRIADAGGAAEASGLAGMELTAFHSLNVETRSLPALAVAADLALPVGALAAARTYASLRGIGTRSFSFARFHANAEITLGESPEAGEEVGEASRWMAGVAVDRTFPIRSMLVIADLFAEQPLHADEPLEWTVEAGLRYQTSPQFNLDAGVGQRLTGEEKGWFFVFGLSHAFALPSLIPGR